MSNLRNKYEFPNVWSVSDIHICNIYRMSETDIYICICTWVVVAWYSQYCPQSIASPPLFWNCTTKALIWVHKHCCPPSVDPEMTRGHINNQTFLFAEYDDECKAVRWAPATVFNNPDVSEFTHKTVYHATWEYQSQSKRSLVSCSNYDSRCCVSVCVRGMVFFLKENLIGIWIMP